MAPTKTFEEYQREKREREWSQKVKSQKEAMGNAERVQRATEWKRIGNDKFKSGNLMEARTYYREAIIYVEDLVDARKKERNELLVPLYSNLAQVHLKLDESELAEDVAGKALDIAEIPKNGFQASHCAKARFRRGVARQRQGKLEEAKEDLATAVRLQPASEEVAAALAAVKGSLAEKARQAREAMGGFLNRAASESQQREERRRLQAEKERKAEERRKERRARAEQRQQMQQAFSKLSKGEMLYEAREKEMEPVRKKELEKKQTLELEQNLLNILDESKGIEKTEEFDDFMQKKMERCEEQSAELDQKKKVLDKKKKEEQWTEDDEWRGQRDEHRRQLEAQRAAGALASGPRSLWESKEVARWCEQRLRDLLVGACVEADTDLDAEVAASVIGNSAKGASLKGWCLRALITDVLKLTGDASVMQLNAYKPPLYYYDYFLKLDWEVAVDQREARSYRTADELIGVAAEQDDGKAPPSVSEHRLLAGTFKIKEFCSEEEPADGAWDLAVKVKKPCGEPRLAETGQQLRDALLGKVQRLLVQWTQEYREHWRCETVLH